MPALTAFSCVIHSEWNESEAIAFGSRINQAFTVSKDGVQRIAISATCAESVYRLDATILGKAKGEVSIIHRAEGEAVWLDHTSRQFARADIRRMPPKRTNASLRMLEAPVIGKPDSVVRARIGKLPAKAQVVRTTFRDAFTRNEWTHFLVCDPSLSASPAALRSLLTILIGEPDLQMQAGFPWDEVESAVRYAGFPIAGGLFPAMTDSDAARGSTFRLDDIRQEPRAEIRFDVPADYEPIGRFDSANGPRDDDRPPNSVKMEFWSTASKFVWDVDQSIWKVLIPDKPEIVTFTPTVPRPAGQAAVIGLLIPQSALDAIRSTFNQAIRPISGFQIANGRVTFDWLAQLRADWLDSRGGGGSVMYCALRDEPLPAADAATPDVCATFTGRGRLDRIAADMARSFVTSATLPASVTSALPAMVSTELATAGTNWAALTPGAQAEIACRVLWNVLGKLEIPLNSPPAAPSAPIVIKTDIAKVTLSQISGQLKLPALERSGSKPVIESRPVLRQFSCRADGSIVASFDLGDFHLSANCAVEPSEAYWAGVAIAHLAAVFFPALAALSTHAATVGVELLIDGSNLIDIDLFDLTLNCYLTFQQGPTGLFGPDLFFSAEGGLAIRLAPVSVTSLIGLLEIMQEELRKWYTPHVLAKISQELGRTMMGIVRNVFGAGFPSAVGDLQIPIVGGRKIGAAGDHVYFEVDLGTIPGVSPPRRAITVNPYQVLSADLAGLKATPTGGNLRELRGLHLLSLNISENALNEILAARLNKSQAPPFMANVSPQDLDVLRQLAQLPAQPTHFNFAMFDVSRTPQVTLLSGLNPNGYATVDIDFRLTALEANPISVGLFVPGVVWTFHVSSPAQVVIGSVQPSAGKPSTPIIDFREFKQHVCDVLLNLGNCTITLQTMTVMSATGAFQTVPITPAVSAQQTPLLRVATQRFCAAHGFQREPQRDRIPNLNGHINLPLEQTYTVDGTDPDLGGENPLIDFPVALGLSQGLLHMHAQIDGLLTALLDQTLPLGAATSDCKLGRQFLWP